jgi:hypothetical protein
MSDPQPPGKQSKKSRLLRPFKDLFSRSRSPSHRGAQSVTPDNAIASMSASATNSAISEPQVNPQSHQVAQSVTPDNAINSMSASATNSATSEPQVNTQSLQGAQSVTPNNAVASISSSPVNSATSAPQGNSQSSQRAQSATPNNAVASITASPTNSATSAPKVNQEGTEYTAILELSTTPSGPLTWQHRMKDWGSTAYEGLKMAIQGIYDFSGSFPPLQSTAGALLTISKVVDVRGSALYV